MKDEDIRVMLAEQQKTLRDLDIKVDFIIESLLVMQAVAAQQAIDPEHFQRYDQQEMRKFVQELRQSAKLQSELRAALRAKRPRRPPSSSQN